MKETLISIIYSKNFNDLIYIEILSLNENLKEAYINNYKLSLKTKDVFIFYKLLENNNYFTQREDIIRILLNKDYSYNLLDIDIKYTQNRISEVMTRIEKEICLALNIKYFKNLFIERKSKIGYRFNGEYIINDKIEVYTFNNQDKNTILDLYNRYYKYSFVKNIRTFNLLLNSNKTFLEGSPDISFFYGRNSELEYIKDKLDINKIICVYGQGGVGKTFLIKKLITIIKYNYEYVIWKSFKTPYSFKYIINDILAKISDNKKLYSNNSYVNIEEFIKELEQKKVLLILDNFETLLEEKKYIGQYKSDYKIYSDFIDRFLLSNQINTNIIVITREKPSNFKQIIGKNNFDTFEIKGLDTNSIGILLGNNDIRIPKTFLLDKLVDKYNGNPQLINMALYTIKTSFNGDLNKFLEINENVTFEIYKFLEEQFSRLTELEKILMYVISIAKKEINIDYLFNQIKFEKKLNISDSLNSLIERGFIEKNENGFSSQCLIIEFCTENIKEIIAKELISADARLINNINLVIAQDNKDIMAFQNNLFIKEVISKIKDEISIDYLKENITNIIKLSQKTDILKLYILNSNLINILLELDLEISLFNFKNTYIGNLYLKNKQLKNIDFSGSTFENIIFNDLGPINSYSLTSDSNGILFNIKNKIFLYDIETSVTKKVLELEKDKEVEITTSFKKNNQHILGLISNNKTKFYIYDILHFEKIFEYIVTTDDVWCNSSIFSECKRYMALINRTNILIYDLDKRVIFKRIYFPRIISTYTMKLVMELNHIFIIGTDKFLYKIDFTNEPVLEKTEIKNVMSITFDSIDKEINIACEGGKIEVYNYSFELIKSIIKEYNDIQFVYQNHDYSVIFRKNDFIIESKINHNNTYQIVSSATSVKKELVISEDKNQITFMNVNYNVEIYDLNKGKKIKEITCFNPKVIFAGIYNNLVFFQRESDLSLVIYDYINMKIINQIPIDEILLNVSYSKIGLICTHDLTNNISFYKSWEKSPFKKYKIDKMALCVCLSPESDIFIFKEERLINFINLNNSNNIHQEKISNLQSPSKLFYFLDNKKFCYLSEENILTIINIDDFTKKDFKILESIKSCRLVENKLICLSLNSIYRIDYESEDIEDSFYINSANYGILANFEISSDNKFIILSYLNCIIILDMKFNIIYELKTDVISYALDIIDENLYILSRFGEIQIYSICKMNFIISNKIFNLYNNFNLTNTKGLSEEQKEILFSLGAIVD